MEGRLVWFAARPKEEIIWLFMMRRITIFSLNMLRKHYQKIEKRQCLRLNMCVVIAM